MKHVETERGEYLQLPDGVYWLADVAFGSRLFVRPEYKQLLKALYDEPDERRYLLCGPSGLGKSCFLLYVMWHVFAKAQEEQQQPQRQQQQSQSPPTVFFYFGRRRLMVRVPAGRKPEICDQLAATHSSDRDVFLYDPAEATDEQGPDARGVKALMLAAASPNNRLPAYIKSAHPRKLWLYPWSLEELQTCRRICFATPAEEKTANRERARTEGVVAARFQLAGGNARLVLESDSTLQVLKQELCQALGEIEPNRILSSSGTIESLVVTGSGGKVSYPGYSIFHYGKPPADRDARYEHGPLVFASDFLAVTFAELVEKQGAVAMVRLLRGLEGEEWAGVLRGLMFERYLHHLRSWGSHHPVTVRPLLRDHTDRKYPSLQLPRIPATPFSDDSLAKYGGASPQQPPPLYLRPPRDYPSVDAISVLPEGQAFGGTRVLLHQDTVRRRHPVLAPQLLKILNALEVRPEECLLVFWVPEDRLGDWKRPQSYTGIGDLKEQQLQLLGQLKQAVAVVPLRWMHLNEADEEAAKKCECICKSGKCLGCKCVQQSERCQNCWSPNCQNQ